MIVVFIFAGIGCKPAANTNTSIANANSNTVTLIAADSEARRGRSLAGHHAPRSPHGTTLGG